MRRPQSFILLGMGHALIQLTLVVIVAAVAWRWFESTRRLPPVTEGFFLPAFRPVAELFRKFVEDGTERGASFSVYHQGERLVDIWGGYADPESFRPWREDTVTMVWSATKGVTALAVAKLVERGLLDYKKEISHYWPEFAQNGKSSITVEMLLSHQAGLVTLDNKTIELLDYKNDWKKVENIMAAASPDFPPGTKVAYQALTFAMYLDALIRRVDSQHRNLSQFFDDEIAKPLGIDFYIGLPKEMYYRAARQYFQPPWMLLTWLFDDVHRPLLLEFMSSDSLIARSTVIRSLKEHMPSVNDPQVVEVGIGSAFGFGAARSLAKLYDYVANEGRVGDKILLPEKLIKILTTSITDTMKRASSMTIPFTVGLMKYKNSQDIELFGHPGYGGQMAAADPVNKLGISYVTNFHHIKYLKGPGSYFDLERVFYDCFRKYQKELQTKRKTE